MTDLQSRPPMGNLLSIEDVEPLPNGMATIVTVQKTSDHMEKRTCRIDDDGLLRTIPHGQYVPRDCWRAISPE